MFFVAERAADIAQMRVMRIDLNDRTAGVAVRVVVGIGYCLAFVLTVTADAGVLSGCAGVCVLWQAAQSTPLCLSENGVPAWIGAVTPMTNTTAAQAANICFKIVSCFL